MNTDGYTETGGISPYDTLFKKKKKPSNQPTCTYDVSYHRSANSWPRTFPPQHTGDAGGVAFRRTDTMGSWEVYVWRCYSNPSDNAIDSEVESEEEGTHLS